MSGKIVSSERKPNFLCKEMPRIAALHYTRHLKIRDVLEKGNNGNTETRQKVVSRDAIGSAALVARRDGARC